MRYDRHRGAALILVVFLGLALLVLSAVRLIPEVVTAARDFVADMQDTANLPQSLPDDEGIGALYAKYHLKTFSLGTLPVGEITVTIFPDETAVPAEFGGPQDLNFDGDAEDDLGNQSNGTDLKLIPTTLTLTYDEDGFTQTLTVNRLITKTAN